MGLHCKKAFFDCRLKSTNQVIRSISSSAYVVFRDAAATNDCGLIGSAIVSTTVASPPSNLLMGKQAEDGTTIDYAQIPSYCPISAPSYSANSYNLCFPSLVMPLQVFNMNMNSAWKNCNGDPTRGWILSGIMDPPRALIPSAALAPSPTEISDPSLSAGRQPGRDQPSLRLHNEGDSAKTSQASCVDPPPSPARKVWVGY